jgi:hypothetical protein
MRKHNLAVLSGSVLIWLLALVVLGAIVVFVRPAGLYRPSDISERLSFKPKAVASSLAVMRDTVKVLDLPVYDGFHVAKLDVLSPCYIHTFCYVEWLKGTENSYQNLAIGDEVVLHSVVSVVDRRNWKALGFHNINFLRGFPSNQSGWSPTKVLDPNLELGAALTQRDFLDDKKKLRALCVDTSVSTEKCRSRALSTRFSSFSGLSSLLGYHNESQEQSPSLYSVWPTKESIPTWRVPFGLGYIGFGILVCMRCRDFTGWLLGLCCGVLGVLFVLNGYVDRQPKDQSDSSQVFQHDAEKVAQAQMLQDWRL